MPTGEEFIHVKVPGLCIGGGGVNINNQEVGHLLFTRNTEGAEKKRFKWYQQEILLPGINDHCKRYAKFDASSGSPIPDKLTAVTYCDGDFSQVDAIKTSTNLFAEHKVIANKQHASWSGVEQPADLARVFKLIKNLLPSHTVKNIPAERCPMKALVLDAFKEQLVYLNLASNKRLSLVDFISTLSVITNKACTVKNIQHGFIEAGIIASSHFYDMYPSSTCLRVKNRGSKGTFECLQQVVGAGWSPTSDVAKLLDKSWKCGGLLIFDKKESKQIRASMGKGMTDIQRFHNMCAYQFEMGTNFYVPAPPTDSRTATPAMMELAASHTSSALLTMFQPASSLRTLNSSATTSTPLANH
jgi:hypothetical protein